MKKENTFRNKRKKRIKSNREKIDSKSWHTEVKDQSMSVLDAFPYKYVPLILRVGNTTMIWKLSKYPLKGQWKSVFSALESKQIDRFSNGWRLLSSFYQVPHFTSLAPVVSCVMLGCYSWALNFVSQMTKIFGRSIWNF